MTFEFSLHGVVGGEAVTVTGQPGTVAGKHVVIMRSRVESGGVLAFFQDVSDDVTTWIDADSGYPVYLRSDHKYGNRESQVETRFAGGAPGSFELQYQGKDQRPHTYRQLMPPRATILDAHALVSAMRSWRARPGALAYFYVLAGRRVWENTVRFTGREMVSTGLGRMAAVRIDGVARRLTAALLADPEKKPRHFTVWISDDRKHLPLLAEGKTEYGEVRAELVRYQSPSFAAGR
jgi:hypothetical protein